MEDAQFGVFLSKLTDITGKSDGMVVSVKALAFNGIFRGRHLLVVFYGSHVLLMVHNQFSQNDMEPRELVPRKQGKTRRKGRA